MLATLAQTTDLSNKRCRILMTQSWTADDYPHPLSPLIPYAAAQPAFATAVERRNFATIKPNCDSDQQAAIVKGEFHVNVEFRD
jgi:hypothetical protein